MTCAICGRAVDFDGGGACLDHDHVTMMVRGVLCDPCNRGIAMLREDPVLLDAAAAYLRRPATGMLHSPEWWKNSMLRRYHYRNNPEYAERQRTLSLAGYYARGGNPARRAANG